MSAPESLVPTLRKVEFPLKRIVHLLVHAPGETNSLFPFAFRVLPNIIGQPVLQLGEHSLAPSLPLFNFLQVAPPEQILRMYPMLLRLLPHHLIDTHPSLLDLIPNVIHQLLLKLHSIRPIRPPTPLALPFPVPTVTLHHPFHLNPIPRHRCHGLLPEHWLSLRTVQLVLLGTGEDVDE